MFQVLAFDREGALQERVTIDPATLDPGPTDQFAEFIDKYGPRFKQAVLAPGLEDLVIDWEQFLPGVALATFSISQAPVVNHATAFQRDKASDQRAAVLLPISAAAVAKTEKTLAASAGPVVLQIQVPSQRIDLVTRETVTGLAACLAGAFFGAVKGKVR
jgi:hypothetical protein